MCDEKSLVEHKREGNVVAKVIETSRITTHK
jgi:hypothetical protein